MKKGLEKAAALLEKKEKERRELQTKAEGDLKSTGEELTALHARLDAAENAAEYKMILQEIRDTESALQFFEKKAKEAKAAIIEDDYKIITAEIKTQYKEIQAEQIKAIIACIDNLNNLIISYRNDTNEVNNMLSRAAKLAGKAPVLFNIQTIEGINARQRDIINDFLRADNAQRIIKGQKGNK